MGAEFEPQEAIVIGAPYLMLDHPSVLIELVNALRSHVRVFLLIGPSPELDALQKLLYSNGIHPDAVEYILLPIDSTWARDYGPVFRDDGQSIVGLDAYYGRLQRQERPWDDDVPRLLTKWLGIERRSVPLHLEGGNILSNGMGVVLSTTAVIEQNTGALGMDQAEIEDVFRESFGAKQWAYVRPLEGEATGHIDMFCAFTAPDVAVVGRLDRATDPVNATRLNNAARLVGRIQASSGPMRVHRVDMPASDDGVFFSYTNLIIANSVVVVPVYPEVAPELDAKALRLYQELFPDRRVVGVDASSLAPKRGALRCVSFHIPSYVSIPGY